jgi:hypothetical protein
MHSDSIIVMDRRSLAHTLGGCAQPGSAHHRHDGDGVRLAADHAIAREDTCLPFSSASCIGGVSAPAFFGGCARACTRLSAGG